MKRFEGRFIGTKGIEIFYQTWQVNRPVGTIIVTHGLAEHSECYHPFAQVLTRAHWDVIAWDLRGHGRSEGKRGYVERFDDYCQDLRLLTDHCIAHEKIDTKGPRVLLGHSMGGLISIKTLVESGDLGYRALCLSSPLLGLAIKVPKVKQFVAELAGEWLPSVTLYNEIQYEDLTRDADIRRGYASDPLRHDKISPRVFLGMIESMAEASNKSSQIQIPVLMQLSGQDRIVSTPAAEQFFLDLSTPKKKLHIYPESYHEIFNDLDRDLAFRHLKEFLSEMV